MRTGPALLAAAALLALAGCAPSESHVTAAPSASATPVFASDAEALAAAEKAYAAYLKVSDDILIDGGRQPDRLLSVATKSVYADELAGFEAIQAKDWHSTGGSRADHFALQSYAPGQLRDFVTVFLCSDVSAVDVVDSSGNSVVSPNRPSRSAFEVSFSYRAATPTRLVVSNKEVWDGGGVC